MSVLRSVTVTHPSAMDMSATIGTSVRDSKVYVRINHRAHIDCIAELELSAWRELSAEIEAIADRVEKSNAKSVS